MTITLENLQALDLAYRGFGLKCLAILKVEEGRDTLSAACDSMNGTMTIMLDKAQHIGEMTKEAAAFVDSIQSSIETLANSRATLAQMEANLLEMHGEADGLLHSLQLALNTMKGDHHVPH